MLRIVASLFVLSALAGCAPSLLVSARHAGPAAVREHRADARPLELAALVDVPASAAWNAMVHAVQEQAPIATASFSARRVTTHWVYEAPTSGDGITERSDRG